MREYNIVKSQFWTGTTGRLLRQEGMAVHYLAVYLMTNPHTRMTGIYYLPKLFMFHETAIPTYEETCAAFDRLCQLGFCCYDDEAEYVWVKNMAYYQVGEQLRPNDNRIKSVNLLYESLPTLSFLREFYDYYQELLQLSTARASRSPSQGPLEPLRSSSRAPCTPVSVVPDPLQSPSEAPLSDPITVEKPLRSPFEGPPKPLRSQEQEQIQEQDQGQEQTQDGVARVRPCERYDTDTVLIFQHWKSTLGHPEAVLDDKRKQLIRQARRMGYSTQQLCDAISGCAVTPHNLGNNDRGQRYDGLQLILRDADQIDRFIHNYRNPPQPPNPAEQALQINIRAAKTWLEMKAKEDTHGK